MASHLDVHAAYEVVHLAHSVAVDHGLGGHGVPMFVLVEADQHGDPSHDGPGEYEEMIR